MNHHLFFWQNSKNAVKKWYFTVTQWYHVDTSSFSSLKHEAGWLCPEAIEEVKRETYGNTWDVSQVLGPLEKEIVSHLFVNDEARFFLSQVWNDRFWKCDH